MQKGLDAIAHPGRRAMIGLLLDGERPAGDLAERVQMSQPVASQHLRVLREAGLVRVRRDGNRRLYSVDFAALMRLREELDAFWGTSLSALRQVVEGGPDSVATTPDPGS